MLIISLDTRLEQFRAKHELARNFYDDHEFCPLYEIEEVSLMLTIVIIAILIM